MRRAWQVASLAFLAVAVFVLVTSQEYPLYDRLGPGQGFFAFWLSIITGILAIALFINTRRATSHDLGDGAFFPDRPALLRILLVLAGMAMTVALLEPLGYRLVALVLMVYLPLVLGERNLPVIAAFALAGSFGVFHVFYYWLKLPLPVGILGI